MTQEERQERSNTISYNLELTRKMTAKIYENLDQIAKMGCFEANDGDRDICVLRYEAPEVLYKMRLEAMNPDEGDSVGYRLVLWIQRALFRLSNWISRGLRKKVGRVSLKYTIYLGSYDGEELYMGLYYATKDKQADIK